MDKELVTELAKRYAFGIAQTIEYMSVFDKEWEQAKQRVKASNKDLSKILITPKKGWRGKA